MRKTSLHKRCHICRQVGQNRSNYPQAYQAKLNSTRSGQPHQPTPKQQNQATKPSTQSFHQPSQPFTQASQQPSTEASQQLSQPSQPFNEVAQPQDIASQPSMQSPV